jgi:hypothetical protein
MNPPIHPRSASNPGHSKPSLVDLLSHWPIFEAYCEHIDARDLVILRKISKRLHDNWRVYTDKLWDVNAKLKRFVDNPVGFRTMMVQSEAIISGSFVLQYMGGMLYRESDLDVYVSRRYVEAFRRYLKETEGYTLDATEGRDEDFDYLFRTRLHEECLLCTIVVSSD